MSGYKCIELVYYQNTINKKCNPFQQKIGTGLFALSGNYKGIFGSLMADGGFAFATFEKSQRTNIGVAKEKKLEIATP